MKENKICIDSGKKVFFTSDTHFSHTNIIKYCSRPFESVDEMNEALIKNWNKVVPKDGIVFHLGDFGFMGSQKFKEITDRLNGKIYLVIGNHDWKMLKDGSMARFETVSQQLYIQVEGQKIYLNHFPMLTFAGCWREPDRCTWQLFGHVHSGPLNQTGLDNSRLNNLLPTQYDVGVDNNNFTPVKFTTVKKIIEDQIMSLNIYRGVNTEINNN